MHLSKHRMASIVIQIFCPCFSYKDKNYVWTLLLSCQYSCSAFYLGSFIKDNFFCSTDYQVVNVKM